MVQSNVDVERQWNKFPIFCQSVKIYIIFYIFQVSKNEHLCITNKDGAVFTQQTSCSLCLAADCQLSCCECSLWHPVKRFNAKCCGQLCQVQPGFLFIPWSNYSCKLYFSAIEKSHCAVFLGQFTYLLFIRSLLQKLFLKHNQQVSNATMGKLIWMGRQANSDQRQAYYGQMDGWTG